MEQILKIEHIALNVAQASNIAQWYVEHLGLTIVRDVGDANQTTFLADDKGHTVIELYSNPIAEVPDYAATSPYNLHIAFAVDDIDHERQRLIAADATQEGDTQVLPNGDKLAFIRDPWGLTIQLTERTKPLLG
ncbi:MAG: VOC family protein [Anaerolineae bacterium]|nr:VOC family protein [Anaerolineae bacterium]